MFEEFTCKMCSFYGIYKESQSPDKCPACGSKWYIFSFTDKPREEIKFVNIGYKDTPRYSVSLGVSENQIEDAKRLHPQAEWKKFGHSYRPLIKNRAEKKLMMKQAGYEEYDSKQFKGRQ